MHPLALVSVVFEAELPLLGIQATSTAAYVGPDVVETVVVIDNTARGMSASRRRELAERYGPLRDRLRILRPADICAVPGAVGWRSQQVLKLAVARLLDQDRYLVLDAKNHFVAPLRPEFVEAPDGRPRATAHGFESHRLRPDLERTLGYLGLDAARFVPRFPATITPFVLDTGTVRAMLADIETRSGHGFAREFVQQDLTEFFLYCGWIAAQGSDLDDVLDLGRRPCPVVWPRAADAQGVAAAVAAAGQPGTPLFAVHRRALARLDPEGRADLARFWCARGLFRSSGTAERFIVEYQHGYRRQERLQQVRDLPGTVRTIPRRVRRDGLRGLVPR